MSARVFRFGSASAYRCGQAVTPGGVGTPDLGKGELPMGRAATAATETDEVDAETFAGQLSDRFLQCRDFGHNWRPWTVDYDRKSRSYLRQLRCVSCRTIRKQLLDSSGHVLTNNYAYADGYVAHHFQPGTYSRDVFRAEGLTRFLAKHQAVKAVS